MSLFTMETDDDLIRVIDLIKAIDNRSIIVNRESAILTPYYIDKKRYELYHYELFIDEKMTFEDYLLKKTGKKALEEVPESIVKLRKKCFISLESVNKDIEFKILEYLEMLLNDKDLSNEINGVFNSFDKKNLYIELY